MGPRAPGRRPRGAPRPREAPGGPRRSARPSPSTPAARRAPLLAGRGVSAFRAPRMAKVLQSSPGHSQPQAPAPVSSQSAGKPARGPASCSEQRPSATARRTLPHGISAARRPAGTRAPGCDGLLWRDGMASRMHRGRQSRVDQKTIPRPRRLVSAASLRPHTWAPSGFWRTASPPPADFLSGTYDAHT